MATLKFATEKPRRGKDGKWIDGPPIKYNTKEKMQRVLEYINNLEKTEPGLRGGNYLLDPDNAYKEFMLTKEAWGKTDERMCIHLIQSFKPEEKITPEEAHRIAKEFVQNAKFAGFQISYATHTDRPHIHTHFIINTVNFETGYKWQCSTEELYELRGISDQICREYGYSVLPEKQTREKASTQAKAEQSGTSWKKETQMAVDAALDVSSTKAEFLHNMELQGYKVLWNHRKYLLFTTPEGKKIRNNKFDRVETYTKDALEQRLNGNQKQSSKNQDQKEASKQPSYRTTVFYAVRDAANVATSKEEFISILKSQGYDVGWRDDRNYITFQRKGHQTVRNRNFYPPEQYTKEALLKKFEKNQLREEQIVKQEEPPNGAIEQFQWSFLRFLHLMSQGNQQYPHQQMLQKGGKSLAEIKEYLKQKEKGEGLDWER